MRLQKFLRDKKIGSLRKCDALVGSGSVLINGLNLTNPTHYLKTGDRIQVLGKKWIYEPTPVKHRYYLFHKPIEVLSTHRDPAKRKTVFDYFRQEMANCDLPLHYGGRLDYLSQGLMILSSDGDFIYNLTHPSKNHDKVYQVTTKYPIDYQGLKRLSKGFTFEDKKYSPFKYRIVHARQVSIILQEGLNRQVRNIMSTLRNEATNLLRTQIGPYSIGNLVPGQFLAFTPKT